MVAPRRAAYAEESAEVEVLFANMEKLKGLTKKIQGSLNRLESSGKSVQDAVTPIYGNTSRLQVTNRSKRQSSKTQFLFKLTREDIDRIMDVLDRIREPLDKRGQEESILRSE